jgi:putative DNA primase/helicase
VNAVQFYKLGFRDIISVTPPNAKLAPSSKLAAASVGKVPGIKLSNGLWVGYNWRAEQATLEKARQWDEDGANIGLRAGNFPAIDIDCDDEKVSEGLASLASEMLGQDAPIRIGRAPKRLLMFKTQHPFARMRLWFKYKGKQHLVEILGEGQQYVIAGTHPATLRPYAWVRSVHPGDGVNALPELNKEKALKFLQEATKRLEQAGATIVELEGDGRIRSDAAPAQEDLKAPSVDAVAEAVALIPNTEDRFADRTSYLKMGYAIKASLPANEDEASGIFYNWAMQWPANTHESVVGDWKRMRPPYSVGWSWIAEMAKPAGFSSAKEEFTPLLPPREEIPSAPAGEKPAPDDKLVPVEAMTDVWLTRKLAERTKDRLRFVPETGQYLVWDGTRWQKDAVLLAEATIVEALTALVHELPKTPEFMALVKERKTSAMKMTVELLAEWKIAALTRLLKSDRSIAISVNQLDSDPLLLNTPAGIVNLATGLLSPADPDALCSRTTAYSAVEGTPQAWTRFLFETTGGDAALMHYLKRLCGYSLTGLTKEQHLSFVWGPGGNGKSVFINVVSRIMGDYWAQADSGAFVQARGEKHSADLAALVGARLVTANETAEGRAWDEQRIKAATGGDPMSARLLYKNFFTFRPTFKLVFVGNYKPVLRGTSDSMRRRMHLVPFLNKPAVVDMDLEQKLMAEAPQILQWMIEGALEWQQSGLSAPAVVVSATNEYFEEEDTLGAWLAERTQYDGTTFTGVAELYQDWVEFANARGERVGTTRSLSSSLKAKGLTYSRTTKSRGFILKLNATMPFGGV